VLEKIGIGPQRVLSDLYKEIEKLPKVSAAAARLRLRCRPDQPGPREVVQGSRHLQDEYVSTEHLLLR